MTHVSLDLSLIPKVRRLHITGKNLTLKNQKITKKVAVDWNFEEHAKFLAFLGYWIDKGYYDQQSVVLCVGKDLSGLMPIFDYVSELFQCNYRIKRYKVVYFDSALLKYTMIGLGFHPIPKESRMYPGWVRSLPVHLVREFLKGLITACSKLKDGGICLYPNIEGIILSKKLVEDFKTKCHWTNNGNIFIPPHELKNFEENLGFYSDYKNSQLEKTIFVEGL